MARNLAWVGAYLLKCHVSKSDDPLVNVFVAQVGGIRGPDALRLHGLTRMLGTCMSACRSLQGAACIGPCAHGVLMQSGAALALHWL